MNPLVLMLCGTCGAKGGGGGVAVGTAVGASMGMGGSGQGEMVLYTIYVWIILIVISVSILHFFIAKEKREIVVPKNLLSIRCVNCIAPPPVKMHATLDAKLAQPNTPTADCWLVCYAKRGGPKFRACSFQLDKRFANGNTSARTGVPNRVSNPTSSAR